MQKFSFKIFFVIILLITPYKLFAQDVIKITYNKNQNIRELAKRYFNNSDLWTEILRANKINSASELKEGMQLLIPVKEINQNQEITKLALIAINEASKEGAKLFTEDLINEAKQLYDKSIKKRNDGDLKESTKLAFESKSIADKALIESIKISNTSGTALLSYKKGDVENKKPEALSWLDAKLYAELFEKDRTRTLSSSYAEISFKDLSKIRLSENSQAVIQKSRVNLLKNQSRAIVNLEKGEAYALLVGNNKKKDFNLNIPGLDTKIDSKFFWVQKNSKDTKIANYNGEIELLANDSMVVVKENEGSVIPDGGVPSEPKSLLPQPELLNPTMQKNIYSTNTKFTWTSIDNASAYYFMISDDRTFDKILKSDKTITSTEYKIDELKPGIYYWQVAAIDNSGFPGPFSKTNILIVKSDKTPPYLLVNDPKDNIAVKNKSIKVKGETENGINLQINNEKINLMNNAKFEHQIELRNGLNRIKIIAEDLGGNESIIERKIFYEATPDFEIIIENEKDNILLMNKNTFSIKGKTRSRSLLNLMHNEKKIASTYATNNGEFIFTLSQIKDNSNLLIIAESPAGYQSEKKIKISNNVAEPKIEFLSKIPTAVNIPQYNAKGKIVNADSIKINGNEITLTNNQFDFVLPLTKGKNIVSFLLFSKGKEKEITKNIIYDSDPPVLIEKILSENILNNNKIIDIVIEATDSYKLKRAAKLEYQIESNIYYEYLKLDENNNYKGRIIIPVDKKDYKINSIELSDYLGNSSKYDF